jgi:hypothetical protein
MRISSSSVLSDNGCREVISMEEEEEWIEDEEEDEW